MYRKLHWASLGLTTTSGLISAQVLPWLTSLNFRLYRLILADSPMLTLQDSSLWWVKLDLVLTSRDSPDLRKIKMEKKNKKSMVLFKYLWLATSETNSSYFLSPLSLLCNYG